MIVKRTTFSTVSREELFSLAALYGLHIEVCESPPERCAMFIVTAEPSSRQHFRFATSWGERDEQGRGYWIERVAVVVTITQNRVRSGYEAFLHCHGIVTHAVLLLLFLGAGIVVVSAEVGSGRVPHYGLKEVVVGFFALFAIVLFPTALLVRWLRKAMAEMRQMWKFIDALEAMESTVS